MDYRHIKEMPEGMQEGLARTAHEMLKPLDGKPGQEAYITLIVAIATFAENCSSDLPRFYRSIAELMVANAEVQEQLVAEKEGQVIEVQPEKSGRPNKDTPTQIESV